MSDHEPSRLLESLRSAGSHPLIRSFPQGAIVVFDAELRYLAAGGLGLDDVGFSQATLEGSTIFEVYPPETVVLIEPLYRQALVGIESTIDVPYLGRIYLQHLGPIRDAGGAVIAGMGFAQDVTDARRTEADLREERRRLHNAQAIGHLGSWELDLATSVTTWSDHLFELWGVDRASFGGDFRAVLRSIHPEDRARVDAAVANCAATGTPIYLRYRVVRVKDAVIRWFEARGEATYQDGRIARVVGATADVTEQVLAEMETTAAHAFQRSLLAAVGQALIVTDPNGRIIVWNPAAQTLYGWSEADALGQTITEFLPTRDCVDQPFDNTDAFGQRGTGDFLVQRRDGSVVSALVSYAPVYDERGDLSAIIGVSTDMTDRHRLERELTRHAMYDTLTGLPNRALLTDRLARAVERAQRQHRPVAVLYVDLDQFKDVNDCCGHLAGDDFLVEIAHRLTAVARSADTVARFGGDEFVFLCHDTDVSQAKQIAGRIAAAIEDPITVGGQAMYVSVSIGIAVTPPLDADATTLLQRADTAMYEAKASGRARFRVFDESLQARSSERRGLTSELREALKREVLQVHYQPVIDLASGSLVGLEALVRWPHPERGWVPPTLFVRLAEENGLSGVLDRWVLTRACQDAARLRAERLLPPDATIAVNISAHTTSNPDIVAAVRDTARRAHLPLDALVLEITETAATSDPTAGRKVLESLRRLGVGIALDDFGTGYSSLTVLRQLPVTTVKIDLSFVQGIIERPDDLAIVAAVIALARALGLPTIAEGVETGEQMLQLQRLGCTSGQGYLWSRPLPMTELKRLIRSRPAGFAHQAIRAV